MIAELCILFAIVLAVNLLPAFGPPTWSIIVVYGIHSDLPLVPTVLVGALAAASGRYLLALGFRWFGARLPARYRRNLAGAREALESRKKATIAGLALFALSPVPSAQLFEAAGMMRVRLLAFTAAFFSGRLVSYSIYAFTARQIRQSSLGRVFEEALTSPLGIALNILMIGALIGLAWIDWRRLLGGRGDGSA